MNPKYLAALKLGTNNVFIFANILAAVIGMRHKIIGASEVLSFF